VLKNATRTVGSCGSVDAEVGEFFAG
jgi:hypothetical protein